MATSPRMKWPYPSEGEDPWYSAFQDLVESQDTSTTALIEAKNVILSGGGSISWNATTGLLTWTQPIAFNSSNTGFLESIPAGSISVPQDAQMGFVRYVSFPTAGVVLTLEVSDSLPVADIDRTLVLFRRKGTKLYYRNGAVQETGTTLTPFEGIGGVVNVGAALPLTSSGGTTPVISLTGIVDILHGGTGIAGGTVGTIPYYNASGSMSTSPVLPIDRLVLGDGPNGIKALSPGSSGQVLTLVGSVPTWTTLSVGVDATPFVKGVVQLLGGLGGSGSSASFPVLDLGPTSVSNTLGTLNGGTGNTATPPAGSVVCGDGSKQAYTAVGTAGQPLLSNAGSAPAFGALNLAGGASVVTGLLPGANQDAQALAGDLFGTTASATVTRLQGRAVSSAVPSLNQLLMWNGAAWTPVTTSGGGVGGGQVYYFNYGTSGASPTPTGTTKQMDFQFLEGGPSSVTTTTSTTGVVAASFVSNLNEPALSFIPPGNWQLYVYATSTAAANDSGIRFKLYKYDGSATTLLMTSSDVYISTPGVVTAYSATGYLPATNVDVTDRVYLEIEVFSVTGTPDVTCYFEGIYVSYVHTTLGVPGGTGLLRVANGYLQNPATLLFDSDVNPAAAIAVAKLSPTGPAPTITPTYLLGTNGTSVEWVAPPATGVTSVLAGTGVTITGPAATPTVNVTYGSSAGTALEGTNSTRLLPSAPTAFSTVYYDGSAWISLGNGTTGQFLAATTGAAPSWATPAGGSSTYAWRSVSTTDTFGPSDVVIETTGASSFTVNLPTAVGISGRFYILKHTGTGTITLDANGAETIDGAATLAIATQYASYTVVSNGTNWIIV